MDRLSWKSILDSFKYILKIDWMGYFIILLSPMIGYLLSTVFSIFFYSWVTEISCNISIITVGVLLCIRNNEEKKE
ncbi:hypothetical protein [Clostridium sardiniense]|uniref:hypothetical protein n=1 Tax=Clostridium sardiniense TaxID=29369 RepID=UPI001959B4A7|nr:hypothetical protein [Clostridium sardiniense]MBM7833420.1 hypothetical protein [Clostridium sardiniense]